MKRVVALTSSSNLVIPIIGILTAPMLARGLGVEGRGELAAAISPLILIMTVATLGLPDGVLYLVARHPSVRWIVIRSAVLRISVLGLLCTASFVALIPLVSRTVPDAADPMLIAAACVIPSMMLSVLRSAAFGLQLWRHAALERLANGLIRLVALCILLLTGRLTVGTAVITLSVAPLLAGLVYLRALRVPDRPDIAAPPAGRLLRAQLWSFGVRAWTGSMAGVLLSRLDQAIFSPLSDSRQLGIYAVAIVVSDVTYLLISAVGDAVIGVTSRTTDAQAVARAARCTLLLAVLSGGVIAVSLPFWIGPVFGAEFTSAAGPAILLLLSSAIGAPGIIAGVGLGAFNRPGLRSAGIIAAVPTNVIVLVLLVPHMGAFGAAWAMVAAHTVLSAVTIGFAARVLELPLTEFFVVRFSDLLVLLSPLRVGLRMIDPRQRARS